MCSNYISHDQQSSSWQISNFYEDLLCDDHILETMEILVLFNIKKLVKSPYNAWTCH